MATDQKVQIEVELVGVKEAEKNLKAIESGGEQIGESFSKSGDMIKKEAANISKGVEDIGEGFSQVGGMVGSFEEEGSQALGSVGESLGSVTEAFSGLSDAAKEGGLSLKSISLPALTAVVAVYELVKAFKDYRDEITGVNKHVEAYKLSMAEVTSAIEELAAKQVILTKTEIEGLQTRAIKAKTHIEEGQLIRENTATQEREISRRKHDIKVIKEQIKNNKQLSRTMISRDKFQRIASKTDSQRIKDIRTLTLEIQKFEKAQRKELDRAVQYSRKGAEVFSKFEAYKEEIAKRSPEFKKQIADQNFKLDVESAAIRIKQQKNSAQAERQLAALEHAAKLREIGQLDDIDEKSRSNRVKAATIELNQKLKQIDQANYERIKTARAARAKAELAEQKNRINAQSALEMARINQNLKGEEHATSRKIALADLAFDRASQLLDLEADKNANSQTLKEALEINHQNRLAEIRDKAAADRVAKEQAATRELIANEMRAREDILEIERLKAEVNLKGQDRELELLRLDYEQRFMMAMDNQEKLTLLQEQYAEQRIAIQDRETEQLLDLTTDFFSSYGQGLADAAVGAVLFGESFGESVQAVLDALAREAGVQFLMELAKGTAAVFTNPASAAGHFKAAGIFLAAAALAKGAGAGTKSPNASAAGASGQASSPSGAPQTASAPRREQAEESTMVFNVNFSNSVIYDTKQAAQDAMVDQLVRNINTPRRGSRRVRFANA